MAGLYRDARDGVGSPHRRWERFRRGRDALLRDHPASPLGPTDRRTFASVPYFSYRSAARCLAAWEDAEAEPFEVVLDEDGPLRIQRLAWLRFELEGEPVRLALYRLLGYGGGLFLPFRDATAGSSTYGGGRYLIDTRKHADLGVEDERVVLDFNFAYHPSCAYSSRWDCPLAPPDNRLDVPVRAGECLPESGWTVIDA